MAQPNGDSAVFTPLDGVTATTTSSALPIDDVKGVTWVFTRADHDAGSTSFAVSVSLDGTTYITYNKLIDNVTNTNAQGLVRVAASSLASDTSKTYQMDLDKEPWKFMKVTATETTDGTHTAKAVLTYR